MSVDFNPYNISEVRMDSQFGSDDSANNQDYSDTTMDQWLSELTPEERQQFKSGIVSSMGSFLSQILAMGQAGENALSNQNN